MTRLKTYLFIALSLVCSLLFSGHASAETCQGLYDSGLYEEAIPLCLEEEKYFRLAYSYGTINDCQNMTKYYKLDNRPDSLGNLGFNLYYGRTGCEKDIQGGLGFLKQAVEGGSGGFADIIGDHYQELNSKAAKTYYLISVNNGNDSSREWARDRARRSYEELMKLYDRQEKKDFYLISVNKGNNYGSSEWAEDRARVSYEELMKLYDRQEKRDFYLETINEIDRQEEEYEYDKVIDEHLNEIRTDGRKVNTNDWSKELKTKVFQGIHDELNTDEKIDFFIKGDDPLGIRPEANSVMPELKCEIGSKLISQTFESLFSKLTNENKINTFTSRLCNGGEEYFIAQSFENGLGKKEDFQEAYRLYLIAGSKGNSSAKAARERIRDMITPEQTQEAVCLADYGIEPGYFDKLLCKF